LIAFGSRLCWVVRVTVLFFFDKIDV
jgi:hypothetical protein